MTDTIDWCARAAKLRAVEEAMLAGEMVIEARFGPDMARYQTASMADVRRALREAEERCARANGKRPRRRRYAVRGIMRPY